MPVFVAAVINAGLRLRPATVACFAHASRHVARFLLVPLRFSSLKSCCRFLASSPKCERGGWTVPPVKSWKGDVGNHPLANSSSTKLRMASLALLQTAQPGWIFQTHSRSFCGSRSPLPIPKLAAVFIQSGRGQGANLGSVDAGARVVERLAVMLIVDFSPGTVGGGNRPSIAAGNELGFEVVMSPHIKESGFQGALARCKPCSARTNFVLI